MRLLVVIGILAICACANKPAVNPALLKGEIHRENLWECSKRLQGFADASIGKNRMVSSSAHEATIHYLKERLESLSYYDVSLQPFWTVIQFDASVNAFAINGTDVFKTSYSLFEYSPGGKLTAPLMLVEGGCNKIAFIPRGICDFGLKSAFAGSVGAAGAILYHIDDRGPALETLLAPPRPEGPYVPTLSVIRNVSTPIVSALKRGEHILASFDIVTDIRNITTPNLFATTKSGDRNNKLILGAHTDSVAAGPGINDDGSGINALLEVANALSKYRINNAVMFAFWTAEEEGLQGSTHFVETLPPAEAAKIRAYLNFDMIASPNYVNSIYDGDGEVFGQPGPVGSAELKTFFQSYFQGAGKNYTATDFNGRSDYQPFLDAGRPVGGTFTGAEQNKTEKEVMIFGGQAGIPYDHCYHQACDTLSNLNMDAFELHAKAIAAAVATYAMSWDGFPARNTTSAAKRSPVRVQKGFEHRHAGNLSCSHSFLRM